MKKQTKPTARRIPLAKDQRLPLLTHAADQQVWLALLDMKRNKMLEKGQPRLEEIQQAILDQGFGSLPIYTISKCLSRLEERGYLRRPLELAEVA